MEKIITLFSIVSATEGSVCATRDLTNFKTEFTVVETDAGRVLNAFQFRVKILINEI